MLARLTRKDSILAIVVEGKRELLVIILNNNSYQNWNYFYGFCVGYFIKLKADLLT